MGLEQLIKHHQSQLWVQWELIIKV